MVLQQNEFKEILLLALKANSYCQKFSDAEWERYKRFVNGEESRQTYAAVLDLLSRFVDYVGEATCEIPQQMPVPSPFKQKSRYA